MIGIYRQAGVGAFVSVKNEAELTSLDVSALTLGTFAYVITENIYFQLVLDGSNDLIWQQIAFGFTPHVSAPLTGDGSIGSPFAISAATDSTAGSLSAADKTLVDNIGAVSTWAPGGITFSQPVTLAAPSVGLVALKCAFDPLTTGFYNFVIPAGSAPVGKTFFVMSARIIVTAQTGVVTGTMTFTVAQGGTDISAAVSLAASTFNAAIGAPYTFAAIGTNHPPTNLDSLGLQMHISAAVGGATAMTARYEIAGFFE